MDFALEVLSALNEISSVMDLRPGIPKIEDYERLLGDPLFREMEDFSSRFLQDHADLLSRGKRYEPSDPLHQWSRQWEYPFVFSRIEKMCAENERRPRRILDAGSGITFFPFYLADRFPDLDVVCCDRTESLSEVYRGLKERTESEARFQVEDLHNLSFESESFDLIYCVSVLEHTKLHGKVIREFHRLLQTGGRLLLTFDIALDETSRILPQEAERLLELLHNHFREEGENPPSISETVRSRDILSVKYVRQSGMASLPWRFPLLSALKPLLRFRIPKSFSKDLTCYCGDFRRIDWTSRLISGEYP